MRFHEITVDCLNIGFVGTKQIDDHLKALFLIEIPWDRRYLDGAFERQLNGFSDDVFRGCVGQKFWMTFSWPISFEQFQDPKWIEKLLTETGARVGKLWQSAVDDYLGDRRSSNPRYR